MKNLYKLSLILLAFGLLISARAQTVFQTENFDALSNGEYVAEELPTYWDTFHNDPGGAEDGVVSTTYSHSSPNSMKIIEGNDVVLHFNSDASPISSGFFRYSHYMYVPTGKTGYFNIEPEWDYYWAFEAYINDFENGGESYIYTGDWDETSINSYVSFDTWMLWDIVVDLDNDEANLWIDGTHVITWTWSDCGSSDLQIVNYYGDDNNYEAYFDDISFGVWAGADETICASETSYTLSDANADGYSSVTWTTADGNGTFTDNHIVNAVYNPSTQDKTDGFVTLMLSANKVGSVTPTTDEMVLSFQASPTADAGDDDTICDTELTYTLSDASADNYLSITWTSSGDGSFNDDAIEKPVYTLGSLDLSTGSFELKITATPLDPCFEPIVDSVLITIQPFPTVSLGADETICDTETYTLAGDTATNYHSILWITLGNGTFSSTTTLHPTYTPGSTDKTNGTVNLILGAVGIGPCGNSKTPLTTVSDTLVLTIQASPTADAGADETVCDSELTYTLSDASASDYLFVAWATTGDGSFDDAKSPVETNTDDMVLTIQSSPIANAGADATICEDDSYTLTNASAANHSSVEWATAGDGSFDNIAVINAEYTPGSADIAAGFIELCLKAKATSPCVIDSTDCMTLSFQLNPTASAGIDATICEDDTYTLSDATADNYTTVTWTSTGDGTFDNDASENPVYTPDSADVLAGSVKLTITAAAISPCTVSDDDDMTLSFSTLPVVNAGADANICSSGYKLMNASAADFSSLIWVSYGDGTFNDATIERPFYTPGTEDLAAGFVKLSLVASPQFYPCISLVYDDIILSITQVYPTVYAGVDATMCEDATYTFTGATSANCQALIWHTYGDGSFDNRAILNSTYTPGAADISNGSVKVKLVGSPISPCLYLAEDQLTLTIQDSPDIFMPLTGLICQDGSYTFNSTPDTKITENVTVSNVSSISWSGGDGTFVFPDTYCKPTAGSLLGAVGFKVFNLGTINNSTGQSSGGYGKYLNLSTALEPGVSNNVYWTTGYATANASLWIDFDMDGVFEANERLINGHLFATNGNNASFTVPVGTPPGEKRLRIRVRGVSGSNDACSNFTYGETEDYTVYIVGEHGTIVPPTYTPGPNDIANEAVDLCITAQPLNPCTLPVSECMTLNIQLFPVADAGGDGTVCEDSDYNLNGSGSTDYETVSWSSTGDGSFSDTTALNPTYTLGTTDKTSATVNLCLTAEPKNPCSVNDEDCMILSVIKFPTAYAGADNTICEDDTYTLSDASANDYSSVTWTTDGTGSFDNVNTLNPTYTPSAGDITDGSIELCLTAEPISPCAISADSCMTLAIQLNPIATAGNDGTICENETFTVSSGSVNYNSSFEWTGGDGSFNDANILTPVYTPGAGDIFAESVELNLTAEAISPCSTADVATIFVTIQKLPTVDIVPVADTICQGESYTFSEVDYTNKSSVQWFTLEGNGSFDSDVSENPTYSPTFNDWLQGCIEIKVLVAPVNPCATTALDSMNLCFQATPVAGAGADATICEDGSHTLSGATASNYDELSWSGGDGTFDDNTALKPTYSPGSADILAGTVELCLTAESIDPCTVDSDDCMTLTIKLLPVAYAGADETICESDTYTLSDATAANYSSVTWTTSGDGIFTDCKCKTPGLLNPTYEPGATDISNGSVELCLIAAAINPCTVDSTDCMTLSIQSNPIADAGDDGTVCEDASYTLSDATAENYSSVTWTTDGTGTFDDETNLNTTYTPSADDISAGSVELCLTAEPEDPCTTSDDDCMTLVIQLLPIADAGDDDTICEDGSYTLTNATAENESSVSWETNGTGSFDDAALLAATYTPSDDDIASGAVTLTLTAEATSPCTLEDTDEIEITIQLLPIADAGEDGTVCEDGTYTLSDATAENYSSVTWTTNGTGSFANPAIVGVTYDPSADDIAAGSVTLTLTAEPESPCTVDDSDDMILTIQLLPIANVGDDATICEDGSYTLINATAENESSVSWATAGTGDFDDATLLGATYTPSADDIAAGSVELCLTTFPTSPCTSSDEDCMTLTINLLPVVDIGFDGSLCVSDALELSDATAVGYSSLLWTTDGDGTFTDETALNTTYNPGSGDIAAGSFELCLAAQPIAPCTGTDDDCVTVTFYPVPVAHAGDDATICETNRYKLSGSAEVTSAIEWTTTGDGTFNDATLADARYTPGTNDKISGFAELCLKAYPFAPCTIVDDDCMILTIQRLPVANAGDDGTVCEDGTYTLEGSVSDACGQVWSTAGDGTFSNTALLNAVYTPGTSDITTGTVVLKLTTSQCSPCTAYTDDDVMTLTIQHFPTVDAPDASVCETGSVTLLDVVADNYSTVLWQTAGDGSFDNANVLNAVYIPGSEDASNTSVILTVTVESMNPCTTNASDVMTLSVIWIPGAYAGDDVSILYDEPYTLEFSDAVDNSSLLWTTGGDGTFSSTSELHPVYTAGTQDIANGAVLLTLTAYGIEPCTETSTDDILLSIFHKPEVVITYPTDNGVLYFNPVVVKGTASDEDDDLAYIEIRINGGPWMLADGTDSLSLQVNLDPCNNIIEARATDVQFFESDIYQISTMMNIQIVPIIPGWSYISTYINPLNHSLAVMNQYNVPANNLFMMVNTSGQTFRPPNSNTIINWNPYEGYKVKMNNPGTWTMHGDPVTVQSVNLPSGFSIFPVLTNYEDSLTHVLSNPRQDVLIIFEITSNKVYWPDGGIYDLKTLKPGIGYLGNFKRPVTLTYPPIVCDVLAPRVNYETVANDGPWTISRSASVHLVSIDNAAVSGLRNVDYIGAFDVAGNCVGYVEIGQSEGNYLLTVYGDDQMSNTKDGAFENETLRFVGYDNLTQNEVTLSATFDAKMPQHDGLFLSNGLSKILSFKESATGIGNGDLAKMVNIYPNPANSEITIVYPFSGTNSKAVFTNTAGEVVMIQQLNSSTSKIDVSNLAPGVYIVTLLNSESVVTKRLVIN